MSAETVRWLPYAAADWPLHMAADELLLEATAAGAASLRFYGWSPATVSLGYFQAAREVRQSAPLNALPYVRRPTGGKTLVHHHELTYALALPAGRPWQEAGPRSQPWLCRMHAVIAAALRQHGVVTTPAACNAENQTNDFLCFHCLTRGDLLIGTSKVVGSAQRRQRGALLQHGGILLATSPYAPTLPGIEQLSGRRLAADELADSISREFARQTGWRLHVEPWTDSERQRIADRARDKYAQPAWNDKR
jgi:lipoate-protein ligase A